MAIKIDNQICLDHTSDALYESIASQEEIYLEEAEEEVHLFLSSYVPPRQPSDEGISGSRGAYSMVDASIDRRRSASLEEELEEASKELIEGDSDDPPLSDEKLAEMIREVDLGRGSNL